MVEDRVVLINIRLFALNGILPVAVALGLERGRDEVAANRVDAEKEAGYERDYGGGHDGDGGDAFGCGHFGSAGC